MGIEFETASLQVDSTKKKQKQVSCLDGIPFPSENTIENPTSPTSLYSFNNILLIYNFPNRKETQKFNGRS